METLLTAKSLAGLAPPTKDCGHAHSHASNCSDPECTDASHGHSHSHSHEDDCSHTAAQSSSTLFSYLLVVECCRKYVRLPPHPHDFVL